MTRPNKYGAIKETYNGVLYDSRSEAARAGQLDLLLRSEALDHWERQVPIQLGDLRYRIDFVCFWVDPSGSLIVWAEEVKGDPKRKDVGILRAAWRKYGPYPLKILFGGRQPGDWKSTEDALPEENDDE